MKAGVVQPPTAALVAALGLLWIGIGVWLRLSQFGAQLVIEDEWHALHKIVESGTLAIFTSFGQNDYSIPLTLYDHFLMSRGVLNEWTLKAPMLACGLLLLAVAPLIGADVADRATRALWVALLAVSPLLVYFTKTARHYAITVLATLVAVVAIRRWWLGGGMRWAAVYVIATWIGGWLHPITLGFTLLPLAYFGLAALRQFLAGRGTRQLGRVVMLGLVVGVLLAAVLAPPLYYDWSALGEKAGKHAVSVESIYRTVLLMTGTASPILFGVVLALTVNGAAVLWRRDRGCALYIATLAAVFGLAVIASGAMWIGHPLVLARYLLPVLPFFLLALATGAVSVARRIGGDGFVAIVILALPAMLLVLGPLPRVLAAPNQFIGHMRYQFDYDDTKNPYVTRLPSTPFPAFYHELARRPPGSLTLIEMPWSHQSQYNPLPLYQELHRQWVRIGMETGVCGQRDPGDAGPGEYPATATGIRLANFVHLSSLFEGRGGAADYLIVHKTLWPASAATRHPWPDMQACLPLIVARFGNPVFEDTEIAVFALSAAARASHGNVSATPTESEKFMQ